MCDPVTVIAVASVAAAGVSAYQGNQQAKESKKAREEAADNARKAEERQDQEFNRLNKKRPGTQRLTDANVAATKEGNASTMLTGAGGVDTSSISLAQNTLLGA